VLHTTTFPAPCFPLFKVLKHRTVTVWAGPVTTYRTNSWLRGNVTASSVRCRYLAVTPKGCYGYGLSRSVRAPWRHHRPLLSPSGSSNELETARCIARRILLRREARGESSDRNCVSCESLATLLRYVCPPLAVCIRSSSSSSGVPNSFKLSVWNNCNIFLVLCSAHVPRSASLTVWWGEGSLCKITLVIITTRSSLPLLPPLNNWYLTPDVLTAPPLSTQVFWDATPCRRVSDYRRFEGI
jgi:hypothetical protein